MPACFSSVHRLAAAVLLLFLAVTPAAQNRPCDPAERDEYARDCRDILIRHVRAEKVDRPRPTPSTMTLSQENAGRRTSDLDDANMVSTSPLRTFTTAGTAAPLITLVRHPYLQQVTPTSAVVVWATREPGDAHVRLTSPSGTTQTMPATRTLSPAASTGLAADYYQYVAPLTGLSPATAYTYDIIVSGEDLNAVTDSITTAPATADSVVTFVAFGDSGTGSTEQQRIAALLERDTFDFAMHGGDIAYATTSGGGPASHKTMDAWFFSPYRNWLRNRPIFPSIGNHDSRATNADGRPYLDLYVLPTQGATAEFPDHAERYYSFDYGPVHVIVLDTELAFQDPIRRSAQLAWAEADLAAATRPWKVALYHRSPYSSGGEHGSDLAVREVFGPLFDRHRVHLALSAHEHDYERTLPLLGGAIDPAGTTYVVTGGGGAPLYPAGQAAWTAHAASAHHYVRGTASECSLTLDVIGADGVVFDSVTLQQCEPGVDADAPRVSITAPPEGARVQGLVTVSATASDNVRVVTAQLLVDGVVVLTDTQAPFTFGWDSTAAADGLHALAVRASDAAGNATTSTPISVTSANPVVGDGDILLYPADATVLHGRWQKQNDVSAARGVKLRNPNAAAPKRTTALAEPADYFEMTFTAVPHVPYRFWMRGQADGDAYWNDSVFVQFTGTESFAIGSTSATEYNLEDCSGCGISGWGWQDNAWGTGVPSTPITFVTPGPHTIRIQPREDGLSIDQILLSPERFFSTRPGTLKNDRTIYRPAPATDPEPEPTPNVAPTVELTAPSAEARYTAPATIQLRAAAADTDGTVTRVDFYAGTTLLGSATSSPYEFAWSDAAAGSYALTAIATDNSGGTASSASVSVTVDAGEPEPEPTPNVAPTVELTAPAAEAHYTAPVTIQLRAAAADTDGTVTRVDFYAGTTPLGSDASSPYEFAWSDPAAGRYLLTAVATDNAGGAATSAPVAVTVEAAGTEPPPSWTSQDIGAVGVAGGYTDTAGTLTVRGAGADIWNSADAFHYVWQPLTGDADVVARVTAVEYVHAWVKAGVMIREHLTAGSAHALMLVSPGKGLAFQRRVSSGGLSTSTSGGAGTAPAWVKLSRRANTITAYRSPDGVTWTRVGSDTFTMAAPVYVGIAVSSHVTSRLASATFDGVSVTPVESDPPSSEPPPNVAPAVSVTSPAAAATFTAPATIAITATASDSDGSVARVEFYAGAALIGTDSTAPFTTTWSGVAPGSYQLTARATDNVGAATMSAAVGITVEAPAPPPAPWTARDIGAVGAAGSASVRSDVFTLEGAGADIWNAADAFHYVWQPLTGDADVIARVTSVEYVHAWVKAGVMIRERLDPDAAHALMLVSPGKGLAFQRRRAAGGSSTSTGGGTGTAPAWVKLERRGPTITAFRSSDGVNWTLVGADTFTMGPDVYVGLAVSSHVAGRLATATFEQVTVIPR